jgi:crotonyl-CoA carboxylase/reductase
MQTIEIGTLPPLGELPEYMYAQTLKQNRYNIPSKAFEIEKVKVPDIKEDEVLIAVMAAGLNYNSVWAATGYPIDMIQLMQLRKETDVDFQIIGSDCSGIVYKVGANVKNVFVGDEVVIQAGWWESEDPYMKNGGEACFAPSARAWGYETSWGSFAQFCKVKHFMCLPKPKHLHWDEAAVYMLSGATVYRMLCKYEPHTVKPGDVVLIWGGAGGLGTMAIQFTKLGGGIPVAVVNSDDKKEFCEAMGALTINRSDYDHWGGLESDMLKPEAQDIWRGKAKKFLKKIMELTGGKLPKIVLEHPGEATMPTSIFVCDRNGMVVTCAGTSGYFGSFDIRYLWLQRKRLQGSHFAEPYECQEFNQLVIDKKINPVLGQTVSFRQIPTALQEMYENTHKGNIAIKVGYR